MINGDPQVKNKKQSIWEHSAKLLMFPCNRTTVGFPRWRTGVEF